MRVVVAIPTIEERGDAWQDVADVWNQTCPEPLMCVPSWRKGGWAQGLNQVWELHPDADWFICGSDDMRPQEGWYEAIQPYSHAVIAPQVLDPRFARFGSETKDGTGTDMSSFPILSQAVACQVFPFLPDDPQHYYADNIISDKARAAGIQTLAVPSCVIVHDFDPRGRGAGMGDESTRMAHDRAVYRKLLASKR